MLSEAIEWLRYIVLLKWPYASELYLCSLVASGCVNARGGKPRFEGFLLPVFVHTLLTTTGSGIVGPVLLRDPPLFLENDLLVTCIIIFFFFAVIFDPYVVNFARISPVWKAMTILQTTSRLNKICFIVDYSLTKLPASPYYPVAIFGPILIGLARGIGGTLVPCDKGLSSIRKGLPWKVQLCFIVAAFYHIVANDTYILGGLVRGALRLEDATREDIRLIVVTFGVAVTLVQTYYHDKYNPFDTVHRAMYAVTGFEKVPTSLIVPKDNAARSAAPSSEETNGTTNGNGGGKEEEKEETKEQEGGGRRGLYDLKTRMRLQTFLDALKPVAVAAVAVLILYSRQPPFMLQPGESITVESDGLASCAFWPARLASNCEPIRVAVTGSGALVVFKGGKAVPTVPAGKGGRVEGEAEVVWSSPAAKNPKFAPEDVRVELSEEGILRVVADGQKKPLWSSTLTPLGKKLPSFRVEAKLDAVKGALEVYKGGQLQWSSAGKV